MLRPPAGVVLAMRDGVLSATGDVPVEWVAEARRLATLVPGVVSFDAVGALARRTQDAIAGIEGQTLLFVRGAAELVSDQDAAVKVLVDHVRALERIAEVTGLTYRIDVVGHTDADGADVSNLPLSQARADTVRAVIAPETTAVMEIVAHGEGSRQPAVVSENEVDKQRNRRVQIKVTRRGGGQP